MDERARGAGAPAATTATATVPAVRDEPVHDDVRALVSLVGHHADRTILGTVEGLHRAVAGRVFRAVPASRPVEVVHDAISTTVYASVRAGLRAAATAGEVVAAVAAGGREVRWLEATPGRAAALSVLHGIVGDRFATDHPALDLPVRIRVDDRDVPVTPEALGAAFPDPSGRVAVFLHGLTESDRSWDAPRRRRRRPAEAALHGAEQVVEAAAGDDPTGPDEDADAVVLPDVVAELGWTPVRLRYGTGRPIATNGAELADLLESLVDAWPVPVTELCLLGHSMGGLVARSAGTSGVTAGHTWVDRVTHTVSLGTPHLGSWLEQAATGGSRLLRRIPEGEVVARIVDTRARGIVDLRHGDVDGRSEDDTAAGTPLLPGATHHLVAGRLTRSPDHPVTRVIGDLLVTPPSALGDDGTRILTGGRIVTLELPAGHFRLMRDPAVATHLRHHLT